MGDVGTRNYGLIGSVDELERFCRRLVDDDTPFGFDIETGYHGPDVEKGSLRVETNMLVGVSFTNSLDWARYVPLGHDTGENLDNYLAARCFWALLSTGRGVAHNALFEMRNLARWFREQLAGDPDFGADVRATNGYFPVRSCTQVESYLVSEYKQFGLKSLVEAMFGHKMTELHELFPGMAKNKRKFLRFNTLELTPQVVEYACEDALWCLAIHERYHPQVRDRLTYKVDSQILQVIAEMADHGIRYDYGYMAHGAEELREFQSRFNGEIMTELSEMLDETVAINLGSWRQVGDTLYRKLGMVTSVYTKSTKDLPVDQRVMSTGSIALAGLAKEYPVVKKILQWKEMSKLLGSYLDKYERVYGGSPDGNIHPNLSSALVVTGRFACSDPNYQASPKKYHFDLVEARAAHTRHFEAHGPKCDCDDPAFAPPKGTCFRFNFRDAIVAPPGRYILGFDLSQAELRAIAGEAREESLLKAFAEGRDVHTLTAALMLKIPVDEVTADQRAVGKTLNFALLYGMGAKSLADRLAISRDEAKALFEQYFAAYPAIAVWSEKQVRFGKKHLYVTSKFGRRLPVWEFTSDKRWIYEKGERACVNYPIQAAATGDYVRIAMVRARNALHDAGLHDKVHMVMNVHDALEFYVHESVMPHTLIKILSDAVVFDVPGWPAMAADWHIARKWGSPLEVYLDEQGRLMSKGKKSIEILPLMEEDEESGEAEVVFPDEDVQAVRRALTVPAPREPEPAGSRIVVELADMPTAEGWQRFRALLGELPGPNTVTLRTPEGDLDLPATAGLDPKAHLARVSLLLGSVRMYHDPSTVDASELVKGLAL